MRIAICSSAQFAHEAHVLKESLDKDGHEALVYVREVEVAGKLLPVEEFYRLRKANPTRELLRIKKRLARDHLERIRRSDAILVLNFAKHGRPGYVGGNVFLEIGMAYFFEKRIFLWEPLCPDVPYVEEIRAFEPEVIDGDLSRISP